MVYEVKFWLDGYESYHVGMYSSFEKAEKVVRRLIAWDETGRYDSDTFTISSYKVV